jgi:hypothetical protein
LARETVYSEKDETPEFWFNLKSLTVEVGKKSPAPNRLGPFSSREKAEQALQTIRARTEKWNSEDKD